MGSAKPVRSTAFPFIEMSLGVAVGAITFTGSIIAFAKLNGNMSGAPIILPARHLLNLALLLGIFGLSIYFVSAQDLGFSGPLPACRSFSASP